MYQTLYEGKTLSFPSIKTSKKDMISYLKKHGLKSSFQRKQDLLNFLSSIQWSLSFPWRPEQWNVIQCFQSLMDDGSQEKDKKIIAVQGLFGCGKTTMLLGMLNLGFWNDMFSLDEICFCAFNVCIKEEIRKKIQAWGMKKKAVVRTFDSLIYEFCKFYEYPQLKLPNYKGKRLFVYNKCRQQDKQTYDAYHHIKYLFVDECQDLEKQSFSVFQSFFPNARIIFVGDIFQSVQKEPRESLLWHVSHDIPDKVHYFYMRDTPRVPKKVLHEIQGALTQSYPEYTSQIQNWTSSNTEGNNHIEWMTFQNYGELYQKMFHFLDTHPPHKSMILTFSSCITVRGSLGDLARVRRIIQQKGYPVNTNYKSMDKNSLFLSTANSSKGLERDFVFVLSTFPLEKAFINFSNDITTNLVTVALSRAKQKIFFCVPSDKSKFSQTLHCFSKCPPPTTRYISSTARKQQLPPSDEMTKDDYIFLEHNVTELLRQNILQYDTRVLFKSYIKKTIVSEVIKNAPIPAIPKSCLLSEEERSFVGVCIEVLITSMWTMKYPETPSLHEIVSNPYYHHCIEKIQRLRTLYHQHRNMFSRSPSFSFEFFKTVFLYTELHIAIHHKMFFFFTVSQRQDLFRYWKDVRQQVFQIRPRPDLPLKTQLNVKMPLLTGIADAILQDKQKCIYEIKASVKQDWKEDAFIQAFCYAIMLGQAWFTIKLVNLFKNSQIEYVLYIEDVKRLRQILLYDILVWNMSSYMAKHYRPLLHAPLYTHHLDIDETVFINIEWNPLKDLPSEIVVMRMLSPTRFHIDFLGYSINDLMSFLDTYAFHRYLFCGSQSSLMEKIKLKDSKKKMEWILEVYPMLKDIVVMDNENRMEKENECHQKRSTTIQFNNIVLQTMLYVSKLLISTMDV